MSLRNTIVVVFDAVVVGPGGCGEQKQSLSITTGGTGGVYYPLGGALAILLSEKPPGFQVISEVTGGSVDNLKLARNEQADMGFTMVDATYDASSGCDRFEGKPLPVRTLAAMYPNRMHAVTVEGAGIANFRSRAGKRVSVGSPGSATEIMAMRGLEAYGLDQSVNRERLSVADHGYCGNGHRRYCRPGGGCAELVAPRNAAARAHHAYRRRPAFGLC